MGQGSFGPILAGAGPIWTVAWAGAHIGRPIWAGTHIGPRVIWAQASMGPVLGPTSFHSLTPPPIFPITIALWALLIGIDSSFLDVAG